MSHTEASYRAELEREIKRDAEAIVSERRRAWKLASEMMEREFESVDWTLSMKNLEAFGRRSLSVNAS